MHRPGLPAEVRLLRKEVRMIPILIWLAIFLLGVLVIAVVLRRKYRKNVLRLPKEWMDAADKAEAEGVEINVIGRPSAFRKKCEGCGKVAEFRCTDCKLYFCFKNGCPMFDETHPCEPVGGQPNAPHP